MGTFKKKAPPNIQLSEGLQVLKMTCSGLPSGLALWARAAKRLNSVYEGGRGMADKRRQKTPAICSCAGIAFCFTVCITECWIRPIPFPSLQQLGLGSRESNARFSRTLLHI
jgi:hypothetical protein